MKIVFSRWQAQNPSPASELDYVNPFTLLVAVVLSAQATDKSVNLATKDLFAVADTPEKMNRYIRTIYNKTNDMVKTVMLCERLIVYGNRYRSSYQEVDVNLDEATDLFNRGQYKKSLDILVSTLSEIDTSIKDRFEIN